MLKKLKNKLRRFYLRKVKHMDESAITVLNLRKRGVTIGEGCRIFTAISSTEPWLIQIGSRVTVSSDVSFCTHDNAIIKAISGKTDVIGRIDVGDDCFIGMKSILMYGVTLGDHCIVGAGSVVTKSFPPHTVVAGNPAKALCTIEQYAEKYAPYAIDFSQIPYSERREFVRKHDNLLVKR